MSSHESGPGAGTFPRCPGIPRSGGPPALFQSASLGQGMNHSALRMGQMLCRSRQNLPQNLQPGQAWPHPGAGLVCEKGIQGPGEPHLGGLCEEAAWHRRASRHNIHDADLRALGHSFPVSGTWPPCPGPLPNSHPSLRYCSLRASVLVLSSPVKNNIPLLWALGELGEHSGTPRLLGVGVPPPSPAEPAGPRGWRAIDSAWLALASHPHPL